MTSPFTTATDFQRTRDFGQKISAVFDFIRIHIRPLLQCLVQYALPVPLVGFIAAVVAQKLFFPGYQPTGVSAVFGAGAAPAVLLSYIPLLLGYALLILTVYGYLILRMDTPPAQPVQPAQVGAFVWARFAGTLGSLFALFVVLLLAMMLLVIPGIWLSIPASLFFIVKLRENLSFSDALTRAVALVKNHWWETFGLLFVMNIIQSILPMMVQMIGLAAVGVGATVVSGNSNVDLPILTYAWLAVGNMVSLLMYSLLLLAAAFQYFHLVEVKEGRGMYSLLDQLGKPAPAGPTANRYQADEEGEY